ncbi:MAG: TonB-dependent receptor [Planctomycetota bacterium]
MSLRRPSVRRLAPGFLLLPILVGAGWSAPPPGKEGDEEELADLTELSIEELLEHEVEIVYGASRHRQQIREAPSSVTILIGEDFRTFGWRTLAEALESAAGLYASDDRNYLHLGVRGFSPPGDFTTRVLLLIDGHRANQLVYDAASSGLDMPIDVDLIDRLEIIRGPGSSLYGSNAFLAVVNVVTKDGEDLGGIELQAGTGSHGTRDGRATWGGTAGDDLQILLSGSAYRSAGARLYYPEFADTPSGGWTEGTDYEEAVSLFAEVLRAPFSLRAAFVDRTKGIPTGSYETVFDDDRSRTIDQQAFLDLACDADLGGEWSTRARFFYDEYRYRGFFPFDYEETGVPPFVVNRDRTDGRSWGAEITASGPAGGRHVLTAGAEFRDLLRLDQANWDEEVYLDDQRNGMVWGVFVQDELELGEKLSATAGLRHDHYDTFGGTTNPRVGLLYAPRETTAVKLVYGTAFRAPNAYELYYDDGDRTMKSSPDLDPETIATYEAIVEQDLGHGLDASLALFDYRIEDLIVQTVDPSDGLLVFENSDEVEAFGAEMGLGGRWRSEWRFRLSYSAQLARDADTEAHLPSSPNHLSKLNLVAPLPGDDFLLGLELRYSGRRITLAGDTADPYLLAHVNLVGRELARGLGLAVAVRNLFDEEYADPVSAELEQDLLPRDGRTILVQLTYRR